MPSEFSFDVVSKVDLQEVENAVAQGNKEIQTRFDFKGSVSKIEWDKKTSIFTLHSDDDYRLKSVIDILQGKLIKRGVSIKSLEFKPIEVAMGATVRQPIALTQGIASDKAKEIVRALKDAKIKVNASIQGDQLRVIGKSKDDLQAAIAFMKNGDFGLPLQFTNYR